MEKFFSVLRVIAPIFTLIALGLMAKKREMMMAEHVQGLQKFVTKFCLPCVLFNSCLSASVEMESLTSMLLVDVAIFASCLLGFRLRKKTYHYHNLPLLFAAKESGMLGIPLYLTLFGSAHLFRMGVLDVAQSFIAIPVIALLSADTAENTSVPEIAKAVIRSPLLLASMIGLTLNLSGGLQWLNGIGIGPVLTDTTGFLAQPVSAAMLFSVGYNFSLDRQSRGAIFRIAGLHIAVFAVFGIVMQLGLSLAASVDVHTRWAMLLYSMLPASYLAPGFGHNQEEYTVSAGVCSLLTVVCLVVFCVIAIVAL